MAALKRFKRAYKILALILTETGRGILIYLEEGKSSGTPLLSLKLKTLYVDSVLYGTSGSKR